MTRRIHLGRGMVALTNKTPYAIAHDRALTCESDADRNRFLDTYNRVHAVAPSTTTLEELDALAEGCRVTGPADEAAMVEALAACRAEGTLL